MTYGLLYVPALNIFRLRCETTMDQWQHTEEELRAKFGDDAKLLEWIQFAKDNPNKDCIWDMLP